MISGIRTLSAVILLWAGAASAAGWTLDALAEALQGRTADQVRYTERRDIEYLSQPLLSEGVMRLDGGVLLKRVTAPDPETFEVRDDEVVHTDADKTETRFDIDRNPVLRGLVMTLRAVLGGDMAPLRDLFALELSGTEQAWQLAMTPRDGMLREHLRVIRLDGSGGDVRRIRIDERNGDKTVIQIEHE